MRCTRCDRIAVPQAVGLSPTGLVVFGWCLDCLAEARCQLVEIPGDGPFAPRGFRRRRKRRATRRTSRRIRGGSRRLALALIAAIMAGLAALLTVGGAVLRAATLPPRRLAAPTLLAAGGLMAATSLALWLASLDRRRARRVLLKVVQVAAAVVAFGALIRGIVLYDPHRNVTLMGIVLTAFAISWAAHHAERRLLGAAPFRAL